MLVTIASMFGATHVTGEFEQTAFKAFDVAVHPSNCRQLILKLQSGLLKPCHTQSHRHTHFVREQQNKEKTVVDGQVS